MTPAKSLPLPHGGVALWLAAAGPPRKNLQVDLVQPGDVHPHPNLTRGWLRPFVVLDMQHRGAAELVETYVACHLDSIGTPGGCRAPDFCDRKLRGVHRMFKIVWSNVREPVLRAR